MDKLYLEGTEDILQYLDKTDKDKILKLVSNCRFRDPNVATIKLKKEFVDTMNCKRSIIKKAILETFDFYRLYIPKGFSNIFGSTDFINEEGLLYSFTRRLIPTTLNNKGYVVTTVKIGPLLKHISIHRLVAMTFIPNPDNKPQVNHKDGIKTNNHVTNLEWNTNLENMRHATRTGLRNTDKMRANGNGEKNSQALINKANVRYIRSSHADVIHNLTLELSKEFSVSYEDIVSVRDYKNKLPIPRYTYADKVCNSRNLEVLMDIEKLCCKDSNHYIRGKFNSVRVKNNIVLSKKYNVSLSLIRDVVSRRSWDYKDC